MIKIFFFVLIVFSYIVNLYLDSCMCDTVKLHIYLNNHVNGYLSIINCKIFHTHTISDSVASNISGSVFSYPPTVKSKAICSSTFLVFHISEAVIDRQIKEAFDDRITIRKSASISRCSLIVALRGGASPQYRLPHFASWERISLPIASSIDTIFPTRAITCTLSPSMINWHDNNHYYKFFLKYKMHFIFDINSLIKMFDEILIGTFIFYLYIFFLF